MEQEPFLPGSIDEQIEHLVQTPHGPELPDERLVQDTSTLYQEYERSRDRVWARLQEHITYNATPAKQELPPLENKILHHRRYNRMKQNVLQPGRSGVQRFGLIAAVIFAAVLVGGMVGIIQLAHHTTNQPTTINNSASTAAQQNTLSSTYVGSSSNVVSMDAKTGKIIWTYNLPAADLNTLKAPRVIPAGDTVYIALMSFNQKVKSAIIALDALNGHVRWSHQFDTTSEIGELALANGTLYGEVNTNHVRPAPPTPTPIQPTPRPALPTPTPPASIQPTPAPQAGVATLSSVVYAFNAADGKEQSTYRFEGAVDHITISSGVLYTTINQNLSATNLSTGQHLWSASIGDGGTNQFLVGPRVANGIVLTALENFNRSGMIFAYNANNGTKLWQSNLITTETSSMTVTNNVVYFGSMQGTLYAYDARQGKLLWSTSTSGAIETAPSVTNDTVYVPEFVSSSNSVQVIALDASNGQRKWHVSLNGGQMLSLTTNNDAVYLSTSGITDTNTSSKIYALHNTDGSQLWSNTIQGSAETIAVN
jgi:outer membrane protein assembly factor BamB